MILEGNTVDSISDGASLSSSEMKLSATAHAHIINMAIKNYRDKIGSIVRELTSNAVDSHRMANKKEPVIVKLMKNTNGMWEFRVEDQGVGLDEGEFYRFIGSVGESNKQQRNDLIGAFGIGAKSPLSLVNSYYFICRKDGKERKFIISQGNPTAKLDKVYEKDTADGNGVTVVAPIDNWHLIDFTRKMKEQLAYFSDVYFENQYQEINNSFTIYKGEDFQYSELCQDNYLHISLDDVYYSISYRDLGISQISIPIALKFSLSDGLVPLPNREEIGYTFESKKIIMDKIEKVANWFAQKFNQDNKENESFKKVYREIGGTIHKVYLLGKDMEIDSLCRYSAIPLDDIKVKGIIYKTAKWYKQHNNIFLNEYETVGELNGSRVWKKKHCIDLLQSITSNYYISNYKIVELSPGQHVGGKWKQYLREKYGIYTLFVKRLHERYLKPINKNSLYENELCLQKALELHTYPKGEWRDRIKEFLKINVSLTEEFIDEKTGYIPEEWLTANTIKNKTKYVGKTLNKQEGDITIAYARQSLLGNNVVFDRKVYVIKGLISSPYLSVRATEEEKIAAAEYYKLFKEKVKFYTIGVREANKLPKNHNFISMEEFKKSKPFARIATSILIERLLKKVPKSKREYITDAFPKWEEVFKELIDYNKKNPYTTDKIVEDAILEQAAENNTYDFTIYYKYKELRKIIDTFYFLAIIKEDSSYDTEEDKKAKNNLIYTFMIVKKLHGGNIGNYELVKKEPAVEALEDSTTPLGECLIEIENNELVTF